LPPSATPPPSRAAKRRDDAIRRNNECRMIPRYSRPEMAAIWSPQTRFRIWFEIEAHAADAMAELGIIPKEAAKKIWDKGKAATFDVARIDAIEAEVKHDVIAFLTHLSEIVGPEARFVHQGMTSSDVLDTCFNVQLVRAADLLIADTDKLLAALKRRAQEHKMTPIIGRSHGIHAEPTTFGVKLAYAYAEFSRARERLVSARKEVATCAISGAVGTFAQVDPRVEEHVAKAIGLAVEPVSTQIIPRDRHAMYFATLGVVASSIERLAIEIRHLQRTEVLEAEEYFSPGQKGSSSMPHKRNPVLSENLTGLARLVRGYAMPAMENVALWHERDISHSSVERMIGPDATVTLDFALNRLAGVIDRLVVYPENMKKNLDRLGGLVHSQRVLIALTQKGVAREDAYRIVQESAMKVWRGEGDFLTFLKADPRVTAKMSAKEIEENFDLGYHLKHVDTIFKRVFG
jgi:adenylosuccinate lyase